MDNKNTINKKGREVMNIYEKTQKMRCELQDKNLKKSGKNPFAKYEYFELQDIIPTINKLMEKHKTTSVMSYDKEMAILKIINSEKPDEVMTFTCPVEMAILKGCHNTQNLGATITYIRRYLYINAFEIVEHDVLDRIPQDNTKTRTEAKPAYKKPEIVQEPQQTQQPAKKYPPVKDTDKTLISEPQRKRLYAIGKSNGWKDEEMKELVVTFGYEHSKDIKKEDYKKICDMLEKGLAPKDKREELLDKIKKDSDENIANLPINNGGKQPEKKFVMERTPMEAKILNLKTELNDDIWYMNTLVDNFNTEEFDEMPEEKQEVFATLIKFEIDKRNKGFKS